MQLDNLRGPQLNLATESPVMSDGRWHGSLTHSLTEGLDQGPTPCNPKCSSRRWTV
jgi:hypothetical protein